jgi:SAM-dependent methyltransferase
MQIEQYRQRWSKKHALRAIYADLHRRMVSASVRGPSLEIGGGIGNFRTDNGTLLRMDIQRSPGVDLVADAHWLPFADGTFSNIYLFDVLHHIQCPLLFFSEAERVLHTGGRVVMIEPGITPVSHLIYGMGHEEPVDLSWVPSRDCVPDPDKDPYDSNQAIPTILFQRSPHLLKEGATSLRIVSVQWLSLFAYPLSGGFKPWSLIPRKLVTPFLRLEDLLLPFLGRFMAFRLMVVLEKK